MTFKKLLYSSLILALSTTFTAELAMAQKAGKKKEEDPNTAIDAQTGNILQKAQELINQKQPAQARAKLAELKPDRLSPHEKAIVEQFLREVEPDILCLQETKVIDADFPFDAFRALGYDHIVIHGQRMHHGVAILSRVPLIEDDRFDWQANQEALDVPTILTGDFNIAPLPSDVWSHKALLKVVSHTPIEVEALDRFETAIRVGPRASRVEWFDVTETEPNGRNFGFRIR